MGAYEQLTTSIFGVLEIVILILDHGILLIGRQLVFNPGCRILGELFLTQRLLDDNLDALLYFTLQVANFIIHRRVNLVALGFGLTNIPEANLSVIAPRDHIIGGLIIKHQALVVVSR